MGLSINEVHLHDCMIGMQQLADGSVDTIITDPPYGLSFMNKQWDYDVPSVAHFQEMFRVLKPGGFLLCFGGTRTWHRIAVNIEDAGFEIRDTICWLYGSGFPKSYDISKGIDKKGGRDIGWFGEWLRDWRKENNISQKEVSKLFPSASGGLTGCVANWELGLNMPTPEQFSKICREFNLPFESIEEAEREVIGHKKTNLTVMQNIGYDNISGDVDVTIPSTDNAKLWDGYGTALKPAFEPVIVAMKPVEKNFVNNALVYGVSGLNIDESRISFVSSADELESKGKNQHGKYPNSVFRNPSPNGIYHKDLREPVDYTASGRFPSNVILDEEAALLLDEQSGISKSCGGKGEPSVGHGHDFFQGFANRDNGSKGGFGDVGGASRFFYCAKASKSERNKGLEGLEFDSLEIVLNNAETSKKLWSGKITIQEERKAQRLEAMETSLKKAIAESGIRHKKDSDLSIISFGKIILERYLKDTKYTTKMGTNSTTAQQILSWLPLYTISESIQDVFSKMMDGGSLVASVESQNTLKIIINEKMGLVHGAKTVKLEMLCIIKEKEKSNFHSTVKPLSLMRYLCKLTKTPTGGVVLDPFAGTGTTLIAAYLEGRDFIGFEREQEYVEIAQARIKHYTAQKKLV